MEPKRSLSLEPVTMSNAILDDLEGRGLVARLKPTQRTLDVPQGNVVVDTLYSSNPQWGPHKLICVGFNRSGVNLGSHPDNEEFILIGDSVGRKTLYLVVALYRRAELQQLMKERTLTPEDFIAIRLVFNDPRLSVFTMLANTVHCEVTCEEEEGRSPYFFVTEPENLTLEPVSLEGYEVELQI